MIYNECRQKRVQYAITRDFTLTFRHKKSDICQKLIFSIAQSTFVINREGYVVQVNDKV